MEIGVILRCGFLYISVFLLFPPPPKERAEYSGKQINVNLIHTFTTLFSKRVSSRLVLSYMKEEAGELDFCDGHSPAVTITFVCPSERREVSGLPRRASWQRVSVGTSQASTSRGGPGRQVRGQEMAGREKMHQWNIREDTAVGTDSRLHV